MYIVVAIIAFGLLIAMHELGHFSAAKLLGVRVNEFAIGMGPKIFKKQGKETLYTLRALPFGGFCAMDEDEAPEDARSFTAQKRWRRIVILAAGGCANLLAAVIVVMIIVSRMTGFAGTTITELPGGLPNEGERGLMVGDTIISINGERLYYLDDLPLLLQLASSSEIDIVIRRGGETIRMDRFPFRLYEFTIADIVDGFIPNEGEQQLMIGDAIISINGEPFYSLQVLQLAEFEHANIVIRRNGETVTLNDFPLRQHEYMIDGQIEYRYGLTFSRNEAMYFNHIEANFVEGLKHSGYMTINFVRMIRLSIAQLFSGVAGVRDLAGPVAIVDAMNSIGQTSPSVGAAFANIAYFTAFIGVNIALVNLLPIPAMDGGRILFIFLTWLIEKIMRRRLDPKYEGYIHTAALVLLMGFMAFILVNDVMRIISG